MGKFKIGDKVRIVKSNSVRGTDENKIGVISMVISVTHDHYEVDFGKPYGFTHRGYNNKLKHYRYYYGYELELVEEKPSWKLVILPDGDITKGIYYEDNKVVKTVEVKRYFKDEYNVEAAVEAINKKLFSKPEIKIGDLVEVVDTYYRCFKGLRGKVVSLINSGVVFINFFVEYEWTHKGESVIEGGLPENTGYTLPIEYVKKVD